MHLQTHGTSTMAGTSRTGGTSPTTGTGMSLEDARVAYLAQYERRKKKALEIWLKHRRMDIDAKGEKKTEEVGSMEKEIEDLLRKKQKDIIGRNHKQLAEMDKRKVRGADEIKKWEEAANADIQGKYKEKLAKLEKEVAKKHHILKSSWKIGCGSCFIVVDD